MMSPYTPLPQMLNPNQNRNDGGDLPDSFQSNPANLDLATSDENTTDRTYLAPPSKPKQTAEGSMLDPEEFRRLSMSTVSSMGRQSRGVSPFPHPTRNSGTVKISPRAWDFWVRNEGLFLVSFSQLFGALMNVTTRLLELEGDGMHPFQILFARQGLTMILCSVWMWWKSVPGFPFGAREVRMLLVARSISGFFGIYGMYYSLQYLPVADAVVITFLAPSVASYGCYLFLKEPFPRSAQYASLISLLGVVLIARPTSFLSSPESTGGSTPTNTTNSTSTSTNTTTTNPANAPYHMSFPTATSSQRLSAVGVAMIGVLGSAGAFTTIRWIGKRAHPLISVNYFSTFCTLISTLALTTAQPLHLSSTLQFRLPANLRQWSMLIFLGICGFTMQFLLTAGLAVGGKGGGARATNMIYTNMLFALALDKLIFGQSPGWWSLAGSGLILGSAVFVAVQRQNRAGGAGGLEDDEFAGVSGGLSSRDHGTEDEEMGMLSGHRTQVEGLEDERQGEAVRLRELSPSRAV